MRSPEDSREDDGKVRSLPVSKRERLLVIGGVFFTGTIILLFNTSVNHAKYGSLVSRNPMIFGAVSPSNAEYNSEEWSGNSKEGGQACRIPQVDPWDDSVRSYVKRPKPFTCKSPPPLTRLVPGTSQPPLLPSSLPSSPTPTSDPPLPSLPPPSLPPPLIQIDSSLKVKYGDEKDGDLKCCASTVLRGKVVSEKDVRADQSYRFEKCREFKDTIKVNSDFTLVECTRKSKTVYTDMHSTVVPTEATLKKMEEAKGLSSFPPSILLLGLDSSSRLNIHRAAPKLLETLEEVGAVEMTSYNKVGDNTLPNLLPILTGVSLPDANNRSSSNRKPDGHGCWLNNAYTFDRCPFIWRNFSRKGYVTMFGEDEPDISIFNYHKHGFRAQPTDHYLRPFYVVAEKRLKKTSRASASWCYANKATLTRVLEYTRSFVDAYERRAPFFSIVFITGIGHQNAADIELGDAELAEFVRHVVAVTDAGLEQGGGGLFLAVFSDHGMRWGKLRQSPLGWLEERVPFLFVRPPLPTDASPFNTTDIRESSRIVKSSYPSLHANRNRLTSPFDFHFTLSALLHENETHVSGSSCERCYDLLREVVPLGRTCADAAIPDKWCACADEEETSVETPDAKKASSVAVDHLNEVLKDSPQCSRLEIGTIASAKYRILPTVSNKKRLRFLTITFTTVPGKAVFEATVLMKETGVFQVSSDLSRLNQYGNQSWCVDDSDKKLYCYCL